MKPIYSFISEKLKITKHTINAQYDYVDLGLPSGTIWAKCNIGANEEIEYGDYFAWAETEIKKSYDWVTYKYCNGNYNELTKYCNDTLFGRDGIFADNITELEPEDDVVHINMGGKWNIPTKEQFKELLDNTTNEWIIDYNGTSVNGVLLTSKHNDNTLFFPAGGFIYNSKQLLYNQSGTYWSSVVDQKSSDEAFCFYFRDDNLYIDSKDRCNGRHIRPVLNK
jgi:hypothetical protein